MNLGEWIGWTVLVPLIIATLFAYAYLFRLWWKCRSPQE